jgi:hypothetical protein
MGYSLPGSRRWLADLFDQEMWCLGRDILRSKGNVLIDLGMCRYRPPKPTEGSTLYTAAIEPGGQIFLWGFGAMYTEPGFGGVFLRRYDFAPKLTIRESGIGVYDVDQLGRLIHPSTAKDLERIRRLLPHLLGWFAKYEHWISETHGANYRQECLSARKKPALVDAMAMAKSWERAVKACSRFRNDRSIPASPVRRFARSLIHSPRETTATHSFPRIPK